jgi:hypothetical protein
MPVNSTTRYLSKKLKTCPEKDLFTSALFIIANTGNNGNAL